MNDVQRSNTVSNSPVSLYADWRHRRDQLTAAPQDSQAAKLLDFLLSRYADDAQAQQPARFPHPSEVRFNSIAMVVNHHLAQRIGVGGTSNADEADARVTQVVQRMAAPADAKIEDPFAEEIAAKPIKLKRIRAAFGVLSAFAEADFEDLPTETPEWIEDLPRPAQAAHDAATYLIDTIHPKAISYGLLAWRQLLASYGQCWLTDLLETRIRLPHNRSLSADKVRAALGDTSHSVRCRAYQLLAESLGDVQDVGLLLDLYALPEGTMSTDERGEILAGVNRLSLRTE